ncbi:MAG: pantetheine-phosphate adenylyltransferase [Bacteroides sp.]|nr:pantetheine-phosphate adenylyltransferase [Bacteroides sp.]
MKAFFAGSFDPFTIGHEAIVRRSLRLFPKIVIGIGYNEHKPGEWSVEQRLKAICEIYADNPDVEVISYTGLTVDAARRCGASVLIRGVRGNIDFEYERNLADTNREISGMETVLLISEPDLAFISSSMVRELFHNGHDISKYIVGSFPR